MSDIWAREIDWNSIEARFAVPAELHQRAPRRAVPRNGEEKGLRARTERACLMGCLLPLVFLGAMCIFWAGLTTLMLPLGTTTTGIITSRERANTRDKTFSLDFRFQVGSRAYQGQGQIAREQWHTVHIGTPVQVRYFPFAPGLRPLLLDGISPWASVIGMGTLGLLIVGVMGLPLAAQLARWRDRKWVRHGVVTPVFIIERDYEKGELTFLIRDTKARTIELKEHPRDIRSYSIGAIETALYLPNNIKKARIYRELDWEGQLEGSGPKGGDALR